MKWLIGLVVLVSTPAFAQDVPPYVDDALDMKCRTAFCRSVSAEVDGMIPPSRRLPPVQYRQPVPRDRINACFKAEQELGKWINRVDWLVTRNETSRGGVLTFREAADIRLLLFTETYYISHQLNSVVSLGDVGLCHAIKDRGILVANRVLQQGFGYTGPDDNQGPYYRNYHGPDARR